MQRDDPLRGHDGPSRERETGRLRIEPFGPLVVSADGRHSATLPRVMEAMLGFLVAQPHLTASREHLAWHLWSDVGNEQARQNLRQALHRLKKHLAAMGHDVLLLRDQTVSLDAGRIDCPLPGFDSLAESDDLAALERAAAAYRGVFLEGLQTGRDTYDDWLRGERARFERLATRAMREMAARYAVRGDGGAAADMYERLHALDPLNEDVQRLLLTSLAAHHGRSAALRRADAFVSLLKRELDCEPAPETLRLVAEIRDGGARSAGDSLRRGSGPVGLPGTLSPAAGPPSLAVLPFEADGGAEGADGVADGLVEDLTTGLSRLRWLEVVVPGRAAFLRTQGAPDVAAMGRALAVKYLITGRVRAQANRLRITVNLMEAATARQLWSERFDRDARDLFAVQDEIASRAVALIEPLIFEAERRRASVAAQPFGDGWGLVMQATGLVHRFERQPNRLAQDLLHRAIALDPANARAHAVLGWAKLWSYNCRWVRDLQGEFDGAIDHADRALLQDSGEPWCHMVVGFVRSSARQHERALEALDVAVSLNPSFALARMLRGWAQLRAGAFDSAVAETEEALRLRPEDPFGAVYLATHGLALLASRRFEDALPHLRASVIPFTEYMGHYNTLISCCGHLGRDEEARRWLAFRQKALGRPFTLSAAAGALTGFAHAETFLDGLRRAGVR